MRVGCLLLALIGLTPAFTKAQPARRPIVVELFTSQGCSSCPPADAIVAQLARERADLLPLTFHVTYWNNLGWQDPFSLQAATDRQRHYVALSISPEIYTPAMVVDGWQDVIGSDRPAIEASLVRAAAAAKVTAPVAVTRRGDGLSISVGQGTGAGSVLLIGYDPQHRTQVGRGENEGRTLLEANIVRSIAVVGAWTGQTLQLNTGLPAGQAAAVLVQAQDGHILGAGRLADAS